MSFLRRLTSGDYRAAVAAEAAGNVELAAEKYALAGELDGAVRMHLARAARAGNRIAELAALRDAMRWAGAEPELIKRASAALGRALWEAARAEGIATERDRARVREAAELLVAGQDHATAGEALEAIGDHLAAANAYSAGGLVERMEAALGKDDDLQHRARVDADAFANYETHMRVGNRDAARADLVHCLDVASDKAGEYRRLLDQLDTALLTAGKLELRRRGKPLVVACAAKKIVLGRDALCDLTLRAGGVSRQHAEIEHAGDKFHLRDLDSRNGTAMRGLPLAGKVPLAGTGQFSLGDECAIDFEVLATGELVLRVHRGLDRGVALIAGVDGQAISLAPVGEPLDVVFQRGRPLVGRGGSADISFNREPLGGVRVQVMRGDRFVVDGEEIDIG